MATIDKIKVKDGDAIKSQSLIVTVTGKRRLAFRIAIGVRLMKFAAKIIGMNVEVRGPFASGGPVSPGVRYVVGEEPRAQYRKIGS